MVGELAQAPFAARWDGEPGVCQVEDARKGRALAAQRIEVVHVPDTDTEERSGRATPLPRVHRTGGLARTVTGVYKTRKNGQRPILTDVDEGSVALGPRWFVAFTATSPCTE